MRNKSTFLWYMRYLPYKKSSVHFLYVSCTMTRTELWAIWRSVRSNRKGLIVEKCFQTFEYRVEMEPSIALNQKFVCSIWRSRCSATRQNGGGSRARKRRDEAGPTVISNLLRPLILSLQLLRSCVAFPTIQRSLAPRIIHTFYCIAMSGFDDRYGGTFLRFEVSGARSSRCFIACLETL